MTELNKKLNETKITHKSIAAKFNTSVGYVHEVLTGKRKGLKGKGLEIKQYANKMISEQKIAQEKVLLEHKKTK